jgi:hypothetical protein
MIIMIVFAVGEDGVTMTTTGHRRAEPGRGSDGAGGDRGIRPPRRAAEDAALAGTLDSGQLDSATFNAAVQRVTALWGGLH